MLEPAGQCDQTRGAQTRMDIILGRKKGPSDVIPLTTLFATPSSERSAMSYRPILRIVHFSL
jgi:hypothetical protein